MSLDPFIEFPEISDKPNGLIFLGNHKAWRCPLQMVYFSQYTNFDQPVYFPFLKLICKLLEQYTVYRGMAWLLLGVLP